MGWEREYKPFIGEPFTGRDEWRNYLKIDRFRKASFVLPLASTRHAFRSSPGPFNTL